MGKITLGQMERLIAIANTGLINEGNFEAFLLNPNGFVAGAGIYPIVIDYGMSLEMMLEAGEYCNFDGYIKEKYPVPSGLVGKKEMLVSRIINPPKTKNILEAVAYMGAHHVRSATVYELLAFGATYPEIQKLTDVWVIDVRGGFTPVLTAWEERRYLRFNCIECLDGKRPGQHFLVVGE
ncbi:hypothetical protein A2482_02255 [Candidatus Falkowbacteria bacterium RIFOXYC2_FULL_48_21]|uniref:Uncharacterized protein n=1 Tax=Candidatus Falkowbacteria bacterium RIFOXYC2_FULL_48_21 TaxID=1798005 RepID=A0A1F5TG27_9BACT|nr:MAG: hypothetical protein A2482_02255 [Candidatus Falkowbacteria bacterium RIFOXYC2_FULL_48_21]